MLQHLRCAVFSPLWRPWISWKQEMQTPSVIITKLFQWQHSGRRLRTAWAAWALRRPVFLRRKLTLTGSSSTRLRWSYWCIMKFVRSIWTFLSQAARCCVYAPRLYMHHVWCLWCPNCLWMLPDHTILPCELRRSLRVIFQYAPANAIRMIFIGWVQQGW